MVDLGGFVLKKLNTGEITPEESFVNAYVKEVYESAHIRTTTKQLRVTLDSKDEKSDLHEGMENRCQHLTITERNELLKLLGSVYIKM